MKTKITVPFGEHEQAKALGARFNVLEKSCYVPDGLDLALFKKWLPKELHGWFEQKLPKSKEGQRR
jgi:hypothetical protein